MLNPVPVNATTASPGLKLQAGRPGTSWSDTVRVSPAETVNILISFTNTGVGKKNATLSDQLPAGAIYNAGSAYLFTPAVPTGVQQTTATPMTGITTGLLKSGETAYVQFQMTTPAESGLACGNNRLLNQAKGTIPSGNHTYAANSWIVVTRNCATPPAPTQPTTATPSPTHTTHATHHAAPTTTSAPVDTPTTGSTSIEVVSIDASQTTTNNSTTNNTFNQTAPQVQTATTSAGTNGTAATTTTATTTSTQKVAAAPAADAKTLVNTGPGSVIMVALLATVIGALGSRLLLYRLLGA